MAREKNSDSIPRVKTFNTKNRNYFQQYNIAIISLKYFTIKFQRGGKHFFLNNKKEQGAEDKPYFGAK